MSPGSPELSVLLPFADHEDVLGDACKKLAAHVRALGLSFEILALDEGSGDNCHALLALLRSALPELRIVPAGPHRGFSVGATQARGRLLLLVEPEGALRSLSPLAGAAERVGRGADLVLLPGRFAVAKRTRVLGALDPFRARGAGFGPRLAARAERLGLAVETWTGGGAPAPRPAGVWQRLTAALAALSSAR